eukprot:scaffold101525_cov21-Prasinocladus_malaysianus.AAC.1
MLGETDHRRLVSFTLLQKGPETIRPLFIGRFSSSHLQQQLEVRLVGPEQPGLKLPHARDVLRHLHGLLGRRGQADAVAGQDVPEDHQQAQHGPRGHLGVRVSRHAQQRPQLAEVLLGVLHNLANTESRPARADVST